MMVRQQAKCPGCHKDIVVRVAVFPTERLHYYILCPLCGSPIKGYMEGHEMEGFRLEIEGGFRPQDGDHPIVTVDPLIPLDMSSRDLRDPWSGSNRTFARMSGDNAALRIWPDSVVRPLLDVKWWL